MNICDRCQAQVKDSWTEVEFTKDRGLISYDLCNGCHEEISNIKAKNLQDFIGSEKAISFPKKRDWVGIFLSISLFFAFLSKGTFDPYWYLKSVVFGSSLGLVINRYKIFKKK